MHPQAIVAVDRFAECVAVFKGAYQSLDLRVGWTNAHGKDICLFLRGILDPRPPHLVPPASADPSVGAFKAKRIVKPIGALRKVLDDLRNDRVRVGKRVILLGSLKQDGKWDPGVSPGFSFNEASTEGWFGRPEPASIQLYESTRRPSDIAGYKLDEDVLKRLWRTLPTPYRSLGDVTTAFFQNPDTPREFPNCFTLFSARVPVEFLPATDFRNGRLRVAIQCAPGIDVEKVSLGMIAEPGTGPDDRKSFSWKRSRWKLRGTNLITVKSFPVDDAASVTLLLRYRKQPITSIERKNPRGHLLNPAFRVHEFMDKGFVKYEKGITGQGKPMQDDFERAVAWLFGLCNLPPIFYGTGTIQNELDLISIWPERKLIIAVECTTLLVDFSKKLSTVHRRCKDLETMMKDHHVLPVVATCLDAHQITSTDKQKALAEGIVLLTSHELEEVRGLAERNVGRSDVVDYLLGGGAADTPVTNPLAGNTFRNKWMWKARLF